jgi:ferredoxin
VSARLVLDPIRCQGHGICALCCPERITLDQWGYPKLDPTPLARPAELARARRAVAACPKGALTLEETWAGSARPERRAGNGK